MREHEGFCVPIAEAMFFDVLIVTYHSCAVPDTLADSGFLIKEKNYQKIRQKMQEILSDESYHDKILHKQRSRLKDYDKEIIGKQIAGYMKRVRNEVDKKE